MRHLLATISRDGVAPSAYSGSPLDRDHLHAHAIALADMIFDRLEPVLLQKRVKPLAGKIVIMLDLGPIRIDPIGVQQPPDHVRLVAKLLERMDIIFAEIEPNGHTART